MSLHHGKRHKNRTLDIAMMACVEDVVRVSDELVMVHIHDRECTDMRGCIRAVTERHPGTTRILVVAGEFLDICYQYYTPAEKWLALDPNYPGRGGRRRFTLVRKGVDQFHDTQAGA